jgi:hypothetical protein
LGDDLVVDPTRLPKTEEELIAYLYDKAFSLRASDLAYQARVGSISSATLPGGLEVLDQLISRILRADGDGPLEALGLLYQARGNAAVAEHFKARLGDLAAHPDFAVSALAKRLAAEWSVPIATTTTPLPAFYSLVFDNEREGERYTPPAKVDGQPETAWINTPLDWTWPMEFHIGLVSDGSGISHMHLRQRCALFINAAGGVEKFGPATEKDLKHRLERLGMAITFKRPVISAATSALRRVVGELDRAGRIPKAAPPYLLHQLASPMARDAILTPSARPAGVRRPSMDDIPITTSEETWLDRVQSDLGPINNAGQTLLAEVAFFEDRSILRTATAARLRLHALAKHDWNDLEEGLRQIPSLIGIFRPMASGGPSPYFVRRLSNARWSGPPEYFLSFCPKWAERLGWPQHPDNPLIFRDSSGSVMVTTVWWRDGGPRHAQSEVRRGEGTLVLLSPEGELQLRALAGAIQIVTSCVRTVGREEKGAPPPKVKRAVSR